LSICLVPDSVVMTSWRRQKMRDDWQSLGVAALGRAIQGDEIDPVELTDAALDAIDSHPHRDRIFSSLTPDRARAEAEAASARAKAGTRRGLLDGVPISWKDLFDTAGHRTEAGTALLKGRVPTEDAVVLTRATQQGMVCLGKTHMTELAFSGLGLNPVTATPPNINDPSWVPGGSSSGAAASVAFGLAPAGIGSDTGGSVRIPAAYNNLVGLKTTHGLLSLKGVVPLAARFDTVGPLTRTVEDAACLLAVMASQKTADLRGATLEGAHFLILDPYSTDVRDAPGAAFGSAVMRLSQAGAKISRGTIDGLEEAMSMTGVLFATEAYGTWRDTIEAAPEKMFPQVLERFRAGANYSGPDFVAAWQRLDALREQWATLIAQYDAVILPSAPNLPPDAARLLTDAEYFVTENLLTLRNTRVGNLMGSCGLTLPTGVPGTGIMFLGAPMTDHKLLRLGVAAEVALA
jgi:aspartyl-tRNA(Asn)/glutamyl-tRNA(Gln) amidotransferase subunit A